MVLKRVCSIESPYNAAVASGVFCPLTANPSAAGFGSPKSASMIFPTRARNGLKKINAHITPNTLKIVCDIAALLACVFPTDAAILAVIVVPIFSPSTIAQAISNGMKPMLSMMRVMAIVADED